MMTKRRQIKHPDEQDAYTGWRRVLCYTKRAGVIKKIKRRTHKRERREGQEEIADDLP